MSIEPVTRFQKFLRVLADSEAYMPEPLREVEKVCCYACGHLDSYPAPNTRMEKLIASVRDKSIVPPAPVTNLEKYIAAMAGYWTDELPEPVTSEEKILFDVASGEDVTLSGNPLVLANALPRPLKECNVSWEPTQEGSGTPYPAGGGANLLDISKCTANFSAYGLKTAIDGDLLTIKGTSAATGESLSFSVMATPDTSLSGLGYKITAFAIKGSIKSIYGLRTETEKNIAVVMSLTEGVAVDVALRIMVSKDTPTAYAPYANIRPISGRTSVNVERTGANYIDIKTLNKMTISSCKYESTTETGFRITCMNPGSYKPCLFYLPARYILGKTITISFELVGKTSGAHPGARVIGYADTYAQKTQLKELACNAIGTRYSCTASFPATIPDKLEGYAINFYATLAEADTGDYSEYADVQIEINTSASAYTPYTGQTTTLALPHTIYGGEVDAQTGEGQETWAMLTLDGTEQYHIFSGMIYLDSPVAMAADYTSGICSHYKYTRYGLGCIGVTDRPVYKPNGDYTADDAGAAAWKAYLAAQYAAGTPVQIAYKVATPTAFESTGGVPITLQNGTNTLLTDADTITATYSCNVKAAEQEVNALYTDLLQEVEG